MTAPETAPLASVLPLLAAADADLEARGVRRLSLAPERRDATPLAQLASDLMQRDPPPSARAASGLAHALVRVADAVVASFPENIFWDLDYLAASIWRGAVANGENGADVVTRLDETTALVVELNELFGRHTDIRFRYTHDFIYGYDWAKWVRRDPAPRKHVGPFDPTFLRALRVRAGELLDLIARNDAKYGRLEGHAPRNPFGFSREPPDEARLHADLAARQLLPIEAWRIDAEPEWDRPFLLLREERARALGLAVALSART